MAELILHHYEISPFAEKIRLALGLKGLTWRSVIVPDVLPKPDYTALTGGYRRVPALQIGADVYCDTRLIVSELEHRNPSPTLFPGGEGLHRALETWAESSLFWPCARAVVGANAEHFPATFHADRAPMRGRPPPTLEQVRRAGVDAHAGVRIQIRWVADLLAHGQPFVTGESPGLADLAIHHALWFLDRFPNRLLTTFAPDPRVLDWMARMTALGQGTRREITPAEALEIARRSTPAPTRSKVPGFASGARVEVFPEERTSPPVTGEIVGGSVDRIVLRSADPRAGVVHVHFPHLGYVIRSVT